MIKITQKNGTRSTSARTQKIQWLVIHYTAGVKSTPGSAINTASFFANAATASADFIVDDETIVQYNADPTKRYCWAVGGGKYNSLTTLSAEYYGKCANANSIHIEMCSSKKNKNSMKVTDDDWYITEAVIENTVELTRYLMKKYKIDLDHVIMHHQVNGKPCPQPWSKNEKALAGWADFKKRVAGEKPYKAKVMKDNLNVRKGPGVLYNIVDKLPLSSKITVLKEKNGWGKIGEHMWVNLKYIKKIAGE